MAKIDQLTIPEKLLLAALQARERSKTFTAEDLVVEAWQMFPDTFGLAGYSDKYPDSNRVLTNIMGTKGMRGKGWLQKVGEKQYRLTSKGLTDGEARSNFTGQAETRLRAELDRRTTKALERLVNTSAVKKEFGEQLGPLTFNDACGFWDISSRSNANTLIGRLSDVLVLLERARESLVSRGDSDSIKVRRDKITADDLDRLIKLHEDMQEQFKSELNVIRRRTDERLDRKRARS